MSVFTPGFGILFETELSQETMTSHFILDGTTLNTLDGIGKQESRLVIVTTSMMKQLNHIPRTSKLSWRCSKVHAPSKLVLYTSRMRHMNFEQKRMANFGTFMDRRYVQRTES